MKHTPANAPHHYVIEFVNHEEVGTCKVCKAKKIFYSDRTRFGNEAIEPKNAAIRRPK